MLQSLFILGAETGDLVMEKHWRDKTPRTYLDAFWDEVAKHPRREDVPPVLPATRHFLVNVYRYNMFFVGVLVGDMSSLFVVELLHRIVDTLEHYLDFNVSEKTIRRQFSVVYQLLEEMVDNGYPMITEPNALRTMIKPPTFSNRVAAFVTGKSSTTDTIGSSALGVIPWRKTDVKYANNEIFFDILEDVDCILDSNGSVVSHTTRGSIECNCHLTGTPDLVLFVNDPKILDDASFHPCVRLSKFEREHAISFIPPDGRFRLATYRVPSRSPTIPLYCRPEIHLREGSARVRFVLGKKPVPSRSSINSGMGTAINSNETVVENIALVVRFPTAVTDVDISSENEGKVLFDKTTNTLTWNLEKFPKEGIPSIVGNVTFEPGQKKAPMENLSATLHFVVPNTTESGLAVRDVKMLQELYRFQSASRCALRSGTFQIRCQWH